MPFIIDSSELPRIISGLLSMISTRNSCWIKASGLSYLRGMKDSQKLKDSVESNLPACALMIFPIEETALSWQ